MTIDHQQRGVHVSGGSGMVAHLGNLTAFADGDEERVNALIVQLNAMASAPWQEVVRTLTAGITENDFDHPHLACASVEEGRVAAFVFGATTLTVVIDGEQTVLDGRDSSTWIDVSLRGELECIMGGSQSESAVVGVLRDGVVPAGGFMFDVEGPIPASGRWASQIARTVEAAAAADAAHNEAADADAGDADAGAVALGDEAATTADEPSEQLAELSAEDVTAEDIDDAEMTAPDVDEAPAGGLFARIDERLNDDDLDDEPVASVEPSEPTDEAAEPTAAASAEPNEAAPTPEPMPSPADATLSADAPAEPTIAMGSPAPAPTLAPARPQIRGVRCPDGHLTSPASTGCRTCGLRVDADAIEEIGDRPALGSLTFDDGAVLSVDRPAAIGADVPSGYEIDGEPATIVRLDDGVGGVAPIQLEVKLSGWDIEIVDMQTPNGTYTTLPGDRQTRTKLRPGQSVTLQPGMKVEAGGRSFIYSTGPSPLPES